MVHPVMSNDQDGIIDNCKLDQLVVHGKDKNGIKIHFQFRKRFYMLVHWQLVILCQRNNEDQRIGQLCRLLRLSLVFGNFFELCRLPYLMGRWRIMLLLLFFWRFKLWLFMQKFKILITVKLFFFYMRCKDSSLQYANLKCIFGIVNRVKKKKWNFKMIEAWKLPIIYLEFPFAMQY